MFVYDEQKISMPVMSGEVFINSKFICSVTVQVCKDYNMVEIQMEKISNFWTIRKTKITSQYTYNGT